MIKLLYKPAGLLVSVLGGVLADVIFKRIWKLAAGGAGGRSSRPPRCKGGVCRG